MITGNINQYLDTLNYIAQLQQWGADGKARALSLVLVESLKVAVESREITQNDANVVLSFLGISEKPIYIHHN